jgi:hypothetical protein
MRKVTICAAILLAAAAARGQEQAEQQPRQEPLSQQGARPDQQQVPADAGQAQADAGRQAQADAGRQAQADAARQAQADAARRQAAGPTSDAFERACIDLVQGRTPQGEKAIRALQQACGNLMAGRADDRVQTEQQLRAQAQAREQLRLIAEGRAQAGAGGTGSAATVEPGQAAAPVEPGTGVLAAFGQAASELTGRRPGGALGVKRSGPVGYTLVTNPVGWFDGLGVNAELFGVFKDVPKFSWVAGVRYSQTDVSNGNASTFGAMGGADLFIIGRNNEGLRIGPRVEVAAGREDIQSRATTFARMGLGGEVGYNFIASNGITGLGAFGLGGRVAGDSQNDQFESFVGGEFGPYLKVGLGFSW